MGMKTIIGTLAVLACTATCGLAATVNISWNQSPEPDVAGYQIHYGTSPRSESPYSEMVVINRATTTQKSLFLGSGTYYFSVKAFDTSGNESDYSMEVMAEVPEYLPLGKPGTPYLVQ